MRTFQKMMITLDTRVFKNDNTGRDLNHRATYRLVLVALKNKISPYAVLGNDADTVDREKVFEVLSEITNLSYDDIFNMWLNCKHF